MLLCTVIGILKLATPACAVIPTPMPPLVADGYKSKFTNSLCIVCDTVAVEPKESVTV